MVLLLCSSSESRWIQWNLYHRPHRCKYNKTIASLSQKEVVDLFLETIQWYQVQQGDKGLF